MSGPVLDHVVLAARSRSDIDSQLAEIGLRPGSARAIPGAGLSNVVVAVGTQLLELHHPDGSAVAEDAPPYLRVQQEALEAHPDAAVVPVAWVVRFDTDEGLRTVSEAAGYPVLEIPAEPPNNAPYLMGGFGAAFERPWLPMFIHWPTPPHVPPRLVADRDRTPTGRLGLDVSGPEVELRDWCGGVPSGVRIEAGHAGPLRVRIHGEGAESHVIGLPIP